MTTRTDHQGALGDAVRAAIAERFWSQARLAREAGVTSKTVGNVIHARNSGVRPHILARIDTALGWDAGTAQGILDGGPVPTTTRSQSGPRDERPGTDSASASLLPVGPDIQTHPLREIGKWMASMDELDDDELELAVQIGLALLKRRGRSDPTG